LNVLIVTPGRSRQRPSSANERLEGADESPLPEGLELRSLRRTFASILYATGASPAEVMAQMGHTTPGIALRIYAQAMRLDDGERDRLKSLVDGARLAVIGSRADESTESAGLTREALNDETSSESGPQSDGPRVVSNHRPLACEASVLRTAIGD